MGFGDMNMCYNTSCGLENTEENKECTKHNPLIEKPDWDVVCHASAWDDTFGYTKEDFRYQSKPIAKLTFRYDSNVNCLSFNVLCLPCIFLSTFQNKDVHRTRFG